MFFQHAEQGATKAAEHAAPAAEHAASGAEHHVPAVVEFVNHYVGEPVHEFQLHYTKPLWDKFFHLFGTTAESAFGPYTPENAVPWYTVMFVLAAIFTLLVIF